MMVSKTSCLFYTQTQGFFVIIICVHFIGRKQTLVDTIGILSALRMRGLHDKRHLAYQLRVARIEKAFIHP